jgi:23S rRNA pseudouridine1911/1915/1917 synthase
MPHDHPDPEHADQAEPRRAVVPQASAGRRFDAVLAELFPEFSRSRLAAWIKSGDVLLDGQPLRPRDLVRGGEEVVLAAVLETQTHAQAEDIPPGVMVVARTLPAHTALVAQLSARAVHRQYLAVVVGALVSGGTASTAIDRHPRDRIRMAVREDGRDAVTHYRLRERFRAHTALECRLETGRTHQIRVHMAHLKHPIVGDPLYGGPLKLPRAASDELIAVLRGFKRQALHAETLEFTHPTSGEPLRVSAPLPADMQLLLRALREDAAAHAESGRR